MPFLLFIFSLIPPGTEHTLYNFRFLKFVKVCFMIQDMVSLGECSVGN